MMARNENYGSSPPPTTRKTTFDMTFILEQGLCFLLHGNLSLTTPTSMPILQTRQLRHRPGKRTQDSTSPGYKPTVWPQRLPWTTSARWLQLYFTQLLEVQSQHVSTVTDGGMESEMTLLDSIQKHHIGKGASNQLTQVWRHINHTAPLCPALCDTQHSCMSLTGSAEHLH